jgi:hypothetical protein
MKSQPSIQALSIDANIYALCDEKGNTLGTGTREVCEVLLHIMTKATANPMKLSPTSAAVHSNIRAAIAI